MIKNEIEQNKNIKKIIKMLIVLFLLLGIVVVGIIIYRLKNPVKITAYIDGKKIEKLDEILDIQKDEKGETKIYIPIRDFALFLNSANPEFKYQTYNGDYNPKTEVDSKCHVIRDDYEVALFTEGSKVVYKLNLQEDSNNYQECFVDTAVYKSNGKLYGSVDTIEQSYNLIFNYNEKKKIITINTLDYIINSYKKTLKSNNVGEYGIVELSDDLYSNWKSVFDGLLIIKNSQGKYGLIRTDKNLSIVLEPQYDEISFVNDSKTFLVKSNGKIGMFTEDGKRKIDMIYDSITLISKSTNLYVVSTNKQYGVVDENGKIIIYPEYQRIGTNIDSFSYNEVRNGYILLDTLIPVMKDNKWGFFNKEGKLITEGFLYKQIGCNNTKSGNNIYGLLQIPEYNVIVVGDETGHYTFMNTSGKDTMLPFIFTQMYIKLNEGQESYWMVYNNKEYDVFKYLKQIGN